MSEEALIANLLSPTFSSMSGQSEEILCISDTTELNYESNRNRLKDTTDFGLVGNGKDIGYFMHPTLCVTQEGGHPLGIADLELFHRKEKGLSRTGKLQNRKAFEDKESYRWLLSCKRIAERFSERSRLCFISDREGDIYNVLEGIASLGSKFVIRSNHNRELSNGESLSETIACLPQQGYFRIDVRNTAKRTGGKDVKMNIKWAEISLKRPRREATQGLADSLPVYVLDVLEEDNPLKTQVSKIHWRLLTNVPVKSQEDALAIIDRYRKRWLIEELFKTLKSGFKLEESEIETSAGLRKIGIMTLHGAVKVMALRMQRDNVKASASLCFSNEEIDCMKVIVKKLEGKTHKLKNPHPQETLPWAFWIIARLSGWGGYASEPKPGIGSMWRGIQKFNSIFWTWSIFVHDV